MNNLFLLQKRLLRGMSTIWRGAVSMQSVTCKGLFNNYEN